MKGERKKIRVLDAKDCLILNILQSNCRISLTDIAKQIGLSIDSTKKRIKKMENLFFYPRVQIRPRKLGFSNIVDIKIKLNTYNEKEINKFLDYLKSNPRIVEIFSISGQWDLSMVVISKNADDLGNISLEIKNKFGKIISAWSESTTLKAYKFEHYDVGNLLGFNKRVE